MTMPEPVLFDAIREDWGDFEVSNGIHVRARVFLSFLWTDPSDASKRTAKTGVHVSANVPRKLWGKPHARPVRFGPATRKKTFTIGQITTRRPATSLYLLDNGSVMRLRLVPTEVHVHRVLTTTGEPVVELQSNTEMLMSAPLPAGDGPSVRPQTKAPAHPAKKRRRRTRSSSLRR